MIAQALEQDHGPGRRTAFLDLPAGWLICSAIARTGQRTVLLSTHDLTWLCAAPTDCGCSPREVAHLECPRTGFERSPRKPSPVQEQPLTGIGSFHLPGAVQNGGPERRHCQYVDHGHSNAQDIGDRNRLSCIEVLQAAGRQVGVRYCGGKRASIESCSMPAMEKTGETD